MMAVHKLERKRGLDVILHTPGGSVASTETIVDYLRGMFGNDIRVIVPQIAMSAGTMIACSAKEIVMGKQSSLGPIDPQLRGIPAQGVISEFEQALADYKVDRDSLEIWKPIIQQYRPTFLGQCKQAVEWTETFVTEQLKNVMFHGDPQGEEKAARVVKELTDTHTHKMHQRHVSASKAAEIGLTIKMLEAKGEGRLQDLVLTIHHCYMHTLMNTLAYKVIENHLGIAFVKNQVAPPQLKVNP